MKKSDSTEKAKTVLNGEIYECQVIKGIRYIDGLTVPDFLAKLEKDGKKETIKEAANIERK